MATTPKQDRNGADAQPPTQNSAVPGPDASGDISAMISKAQDAAGTYSGYGHTLFTGITASQTDLTLGNTWEWDDNLAVPEQPGEM